MILYLELFRGGTSEKNTLYFKKLSKKFATYRVFYFTRPTP